MPVRTAYDPTAGEVLTATNLEKLAGGWIGYAEVTANQTATTEVDVTGATVSVTVGPGRRIRISGTSWSQSTVANDEVLLRIKEGATVLQTRTTQVSAAGPAEPLDIFAVLTPTTGAHTYKLTFGRNSGTGTITSFASATAPLFILVEDIGPAA